MRKYPYTDSTDIIIYEAKQKVKKPKPWLAPIASALVASLFTAAVFTAGFVTMNKNAENKNVQNPVQASYIAEDAESAISPVVKHSNGKKILSIPEIAEKVGPSVVGVINKTTVQAQRMYDPFTGRYYYYDMGQNANDLIEQGSGSGIIISNDGYIVTNQHVIEGASEISVILNTGDEIKAKLIGADTKTDLAVLKIDTDKELTVAVLGDSETVQVGELAVAIGNPMGIEFSGSVTAGIISAVNRTMTIDERTYNLLQTDAAINSGNSGGALINQYGEVIGINSVKLSTSGVEGMGFAIAISEAKPIINDLRDAGYVTGRPLVGISIQETPYGLFVASVSEGSGAQEAGLEVGDVIVSVDGKKVKSTSEINEIRDTKKPGDYLTFKIIHEGDSKEVKVRLTENNSQ